MNQIFSNKHYATHPAAINETSLSQGEPKSAQLRRAAKKALVYSNKIRWHEGGREWVELTDAVIGANYVCVIEEVMRQLVRTKNPVFHVSKGSARKRYVATRLGRKLLDLLKSSGALGSVLHEFPDHSFHPLVELFYKHMKPLFESVPFQGPGDMERLSDGIAKIRAEAASSGFRKRRSLHIKHVRNNTASLLEYIDALFERWSRLLVVRLDTGYRRGQGKGAKIPYEEAFAHREHLLEYLRSATSPGVLRGYAWSLESGRSSSFHYHLLLFFDGHQSRQDVVVGKAIGEYWNNVITSRRGRYYNCNADSFVSRGVGLIDYKNSEALKALKEIVAPYLTKADYFVRTLVGDGKTFRHGRMPNLSLRHGRPRSWGCIK